MKDFMGMMKQAQQLQSRMAEVQQELECQTVEGKAGAGLVTVTLNGKGDMRGLVIDPSLIKPDEKEILEDVIVAAFQDARAKAEELMKSRMQSIAGGLPLPPGMKLF